jgi:hypothetical protein
MLVERTPYLDEYTEAGRSVVMFADGRVLAVAPVVTAILSAIGTEKCAVSDIAAALVQTANGTFVTPSAEDLERSVRFLVAEGLLRDALT